MNRNTPSRTQWGCARTNYPRSRGEYFGTILILSATQGSSPLSRGIPIDPESVVGHQRIIPALAGNTVAVYGGGEALADHPRSRGEYLLPPVYGGGENGSSPLSRGIRSGRVLFFAASRIIPALAGNTLPRQRRWLTAWDHPRSRGEYYGTDRPEFIPQGSSPLSRGILPRPGGTC